MGIDVEVPIVNPWELAKFYEASPKQTENLVIHPEFDRIICMDERDISDGLGIAHIAGLLPELEQDDFALSLLLSIQEGYPTEELIAQRRDKNGGKILTIEPHEGCGGAKLKLMQRGVLNPSNDEVNQEAMIQAKAFRGRMVKMALWLNNYRKERDLPEITFALTEGDIGIPDSLKKISPHAHVPVGVLAHMHKRSSFGDKDLRLINKEGTHLNGNVFDQLFGNVFDISSLINSDAELASEIILALKLSFGDHGVEHYFDEPGENIFPVFLSIKDEESTKRAMKIKKLVEKMNAAGPEYPIRIFFVDIRNLNSKTNDNIESLESALAGGTVEHPGVNL